MDKFTRLETSRGITTRNSARYPTYLNFAANFFIKTAARCAKELMCITQNLNEHQDVEWLQETDVDIP